MRRLFLQVSLLMVAAWVATSCHKDDLVGADAKEAVVLYAEAPSSSQSKIEFTEGDSGIDLKWEVDDQISLYNNSGAYYADLICEEVSESGVASFVLVEEQSVTALATGSYTAIYPEVVDKTLSLTEARALDLTSEQDGDAIANLNDACYMEATFTYSADEQTSTTLSFVHQMAVVSFTFICDQTPAQMVFANGSVSYVVNYSTITPTSYNDEEYYTSHIMIAPCEGVERVLSFSIYDDQGELLDYRTTTTSKAYVAGVRYKAPVSDLLPWLGSGTEEDPYQISTATDLRLLSSSVNAGTTYSGIYFAMTKDVDLGGISADGKTITSENEFTAIGNTNELYFAGNFDGAEKTVSGLYINAEDDYQALFGNVEGATIENLTVEGSVTGGSYVGGVVGRATTATKITNCTNMVSVTATSGYVGSVAGYAISSSSIVNCSNAASISSAGTAVGGVVGYAGSSSSIVYCSNTALVSSSSTSSYSTIGGVVGSGSSCSIVNCFNTALVSSDGQRVGGLVGSVSTVTLANCYNAGSVSGSSYVGGIAGYGYAGTITNSYNCAAVSGSGVLGGTYSSSVTNCYYIEKLSESDETSMSDSYATKMSSSEMQAIGFVSTLNTGAYTYNLTASIEACGWKQGDDYYPTFDPTVDVAPDFDLEYDELTATYQINTPRGLKAFADLVNGNKNSGEAFVLLSSTESFESAAPTINAVLTDDINLSSICSSSLSASWEPIGRSSDINFQGKFDGGGFTISKLYINQTESDTYSRALFGYISGAEITKLTLEGSVASYYYTGGIVGSATASTISYCCNKASVTGAAPGTGGVVANMQGSSSLVSYCSNSGVIHNTSTDIGYFVGGVVGVSVEGTINYCYNAASVSTLCQSANYGQLGGVVGSNNMGTVINSYNTASLSSTNTYCVGGIAGASTSGNLINCYNTASVSGGSPVGGVVGNWTSGNLINCYSSSSVSGTSYVGALIGNAHSTTATDCYYDNELFEGSAVGNGTDVEATGMSTSKMQATTFVSTLNYGAYTYNLTASLPAYGWKQGYDDYPTVDPSVEIEPDLDLEYDEASATYLIRTARGLKAFADLVNGNENSSDALFSLSSTESFERAAPTISAVLTDDINLSSICSSSLSISWEPIGICEIDEEEGVPTSYFGGRFNGGGFTVSGLYINSEESCQGLFGYLSGAEVSGVTVEGEVTASYYVGGVAGRSTSKITNCHNRAVITSTGKSESGYAFCGGVTGSGETGGVITQCSNSGTITAYYNYVGGITGFILGTTQLSSCYNSGDIGGYQSLAGTTSCSGYVGGVVGLATGSVSITNCYNTGSILGATSLGGVAGGFNVTASMANCYSVTKGLTFYRLSELAFTDHIGGVIGYRFGVSDVDASISNCYWDDDVFEIVIYPTSITIAHNYYGISSNTTTMTDADFVSTLGGEGSTAWKADSENSNGGYPILSWQ